MSNKGFSLVELIVVIAIMAILVAVAVPTYSHYVTNANEQVDASNCAEIYHAANLYSISTGAEFTRATIEVGADGTLVSVAVNGTQLNETQLSEAGIVLGEYKFNTTDFKGKVSDISKDGACSATELATAASVAA